MLIRAALTGSRLGYFGSPNNNPTTSDNVSPCLPVGRGKPFPLESCWNVAQEAVATLARREKPLVGIGPVDAVRRQCISSTYSCAPGNPQTGVVANASVDVTNIATGVTTHTQSKLMAAGLTMQKTQAFRMVRERTMQNIIKTDHFARVAGCEMEYWFL